MRIAKADALSPAIIIPWHTFGLMA